MANIYNSFSSISGDFSFVNIKIPTYVIKLPYNISIPIIVSYILLYILHSVMKTIPLLCLVVMKGKNNFHSIKKKQ